MSKFVWKDLRLHDGIVKERSHPVSEEFGSESSTMAGSGILCIIKQYKYFISTAIMPYKQKESIPKTS